VSDIVERLRNWRTVHLTQLRYVMESAADEIERLRLSEKKDYLESENAISEDNGPAANSTPNHRTDIEYVRSLEARLEELRSAADQADAEYCAKIASLRLTDEEREVLLAIEADAAYRAMERTERVVRGLLERLG
jgi:hypothetical protein